MICAADIDKKGHIARSIIINSFPHHSLDLLLLTSHMLDIISELDDRAFIISATVVRQLIYRLTKKT